MPTQAETGLSGPPAVCKRSWYPALRKVREERCTRCVGSPCEITIRATRQSPITGASDKVQVVQAVSAMQSAGYNQQLWYKRRRYPPLQKPQGRGTRSFEMGRKTNAERPGHPSSPPLQM
jgi:hypothetical protein